MVIQEVLGPFPAEGLIPHRGKHLADPEFLRAYAGAAALHVGSGGTRAVRRAHPGAAARAGGVALPGP